MELFGVYTPWTEVHGRDFKSREQSPKHFLKILKEFLSKIC